MALEDSVVIPNHWPYKIDYQGHVYGIEGQEMKGYQTPKGFIQVRFNDNTRHYIHQLVWETFGGRPLRANEVLRHKDGDNTNNAFDNLDIWTKSKVAYWGYIDSL